MLKSNPKRTKPNNKSTKKDDKPMMSHVDSAKQDSTKDDLMTKKSGIRINSLLSNRFQVLSYDKVIKLQNIVERPLLIKPNINSIFPTIKVSLRELLEDIRTKLKDNSIIIKDIRLNMDAATNILSPDINTPLKVVDIIFTGRFDDTPVQHKIKETVFKILMNMLRKSLNQANDERIRIVINEGVLKENYIRSMARVNNSSEPLGDAWSLISFGMQDSDGQTLELKFIERMKRQYEFTVDSFQIILDTLLSFHSVSKCSSISSILYPTVVVECMSGGCQEALEHLKERIIFTRQPEEIFGGGLLKYCKLMMDGYKPCPSMDIKSTEKYMCSRFFIDYPEIRSQKQKIETHLNIYFFSNYEKQSLYLKILYKVVSQSTVCLMIHERRETLQLIKDLRKKTILNKELQKSSVHLDDIICQNWFLDQIFYGTLYFPQQVYVINAEDTDESDYVGDKFLSANQILICTGDSGLPMGSIPENTETISNDKSTKYFSMKGKEESDICRHHSIVCT